jgi:hypothetical protein
MNVKEAAAEDATDGKKRTRRRAGGRKKRKPVDAECDGVAIEVSTKEEAVSMKLKWVELPRSFPPGKLVGAHVSMASGIERAVVNAASIGVPVRR